MSKRIKEVDVKRINWVKYESEVWVSVVRIVKLEKLEIRDLGYKNNFYW